MRRDKSLFTFAVFTIFTFIFTSACSQNAPTVTQTASGMENSGAPALIPSPADAQIKAAEEVVAKMPDKAQSHLMLAAAYLKKVRETGDYALNREAEKSLDRARQIEPENFEAMLLQTQIFLSEHKFAEALELAEKMAEKQPQNAAAFAAMTDAQTELGRYDEAVKTAQKLVDMKPNAVAYTRVAHLRSLYGDAEGAIEARDLVVRTTPPQDAEALAWALSQLGTEYFNVGRFDEAGRAFDRALETLPDYHWALAGKGRVLAAKGDLPAAALIYEKLRRVPQADREIFLADLYKKMGREAEAQKIYESVAEREKASEEGDMHRVALLWADHDQNLDEALDVARQDRQTNADLLASDTLAWALYKKGQFEEAKKYVDEAMRLKTKHALFYYHAGMIENALGNKREAAKYLKLALETNPSFDLLQADVAGQTLKNLDGARL